MAENVCQRLIESGQQTGEREAKSLTQHHMAQLWERMTMIYGHKWTSSYGETDDGTWRSGLAGITPEGVAHGLRKCVAKGLGWPPTLPEFREMCGLSPEELGLPSVDEAYVAACLCDWSHPIVWHAAQQVGNFELRSMPERTMKPRFAKVYARLVSEAIDGRVFEIQRHDGKSLEHKKPGKRSRKETAMRHIEQMRAALGS